METSSTDTAYPSGLMSAIAAATKSGTKSGTGSDQTSAIAEIREKGFVAFLEAEKERQLEELRAQMREQILAEMNIEEADLQEMSPEQRGKIEELIAQKIEERMKALSELEEDEAGGKTALQNANIPLVEVSAPSMMSGHMGLGPLLALQEDDAIATQNAAQSDEELQ